MPDRILALLADFDRICIQCLTGLLADNGHHLIDRLEAMHRNGRANLAFAACLKCGEPAPTYRLVG
jgi:hypothetical protein